MSGAHRETLRTNDSDAREVQRHTHVASSAPSGLALGIPRWQFIAITCLILVLGFVEGWYKRTDFATDAISYLDISRAIPIHDWKMVFNPLWSVGYPFLLACARPFFSPTPTGEWWSIHAVNMVIFLATWFCFLYLLLSFDDLFVSLPPEEAIRRRRFLFSAAACLFVAIQLCVDAVSRVGPDLMVTAFFFLSTALVRRLAKQPSVGRAVALGLVCGVGYWTKGIFLPLALLLLATPAAVFYLRKRSLYLPALSFLVFLLISVPYIIGLSWSFGRFTTGESGQLNYALHVNYLPRWTNWQGGPAGYGMPIHPTHEVMKSPDLFTFAEPYHNTYPPFGNIVYWYEGYRHFWSTKYQAIGIARDLGYLAKIVATQPVFYAAILSLLILLFSARDWKAWIKTALGFWPFAFPALMGIVLYIQVHLEDRYLGSFFTILCLIPFIAACSMPVIPKRKVQSGILALMALGAALSYALVDRDIFIHLRHHYTYAENPQWKLGLGLIHLGLKPGDEVAAVGGPNASCTWAYIAHLRIVAELGGDPFDQQHPDPGPPNKEVKEFWTGTSQFQSRVLSLFHDVGAVAVIASAKPADIPAPMGWQRVDGTDTWVYLFH